MRLDSAPAATTAMPGIAEVAEDGDENRAGRDDVDRRTQVPGETVPQRGEQPDLDEQPAHRQHGPAEAEPEEPVHPSAEQQPDHDPDRDRPEHEHVRSGSSLGEDRPELGHVLLEMPGDEAFEQRVDGELAARLIDPDARRLEGRAAPASAARRASRLTPAARRARGAAPSGRVRSRRSGSCPTRRARTGRARPRRHRGSARPRRARRGASRRGGRGAPVGPSSPPPPCRTARRAATGRRSRHGPGGRGWRSARLRADRPGRQVLPWQRSVARPGPGERGYHWRSLILHPPASEERVP